jgi:drug/metabolite transporter (DMT)-like permease
MSLLLLSVCLLTITQLVIKSRLNVHGEIPLVPMQLPAYLLDLMRDWQLWAALVILLTAAFSWYAGVSRLPLSVAFPVTALTYPLIFVGSILVLGEQFTWNGLIGNALVIAGILTVSLGL